MALVCRPIPFGSCTAARYAQATAVSHGTTLEHGRVFPHSPALWDPAKRDLVRRGDRSNKYSGPLEKVGYDAYRFPISVLIRAKRLNRPFHLNHSLLRWGIDTYVCLGAFSSRMKRKRKGHVSFPNPRLFRPASALQAAPSEVHLSTIIFGCKCVLSCVL
jgi:hypothetical protein